ncbi:MAG: adenylate/guanylate cyclase domain-containing protein [Gammaproteobacteria bacterium]|nr:adenylate/guanylate cyclase domain-containing protein [Gammaproteobacteria bacterium]
MSTPLRQNAAQIAIVTFVFLVFLSNALGLVEFHPHAGSLLRLRMWPFEQQGLLPPGLAGSAEFVVLVVTGLALCFALPLLNPMRSSLVTLAAILPSLYLGVYGTGSGAGLPMEFSILTLGTIYMLNLLLSFFRETRSKQQILSVFGQFIPPQLVAEISRHPQRISLDGESRRMTVFFCDLQNFSGVAEQLNPRQLTLLLNEYFTAMTEVLFRYGATIDKYIGDSIMAFWGAPLPMAEHAQRAVLASFEMHRAIKQLAETFMRRGWPGPTMGIGMNTGMMNVGNLGSKYRVAYTVVGDAVNLASRLETLTRDYHVPTIVSESTRQDCAGVAFRTLDVVQVRGKHNRTRIYQPLCLEGDLNDLLRQQLAMHEKGIEALFAEDYAAATAIFQELQRDEKDEGYYAAMLGKIAEARK